MSTPRFLTLPHGVRRTEIETSRGTFAALEAMPGSGATDRCPALLVPGHTGSKEDFIAIMHSLARGGRRVVAVDMRGQYETPGPEDPAAYTCAALGADIAAMAEALGPEPIHLVGHSFGGLVTREALLSSRLRPLSYTLMSSGPAAVGGQRAANGQILLAALPEVLTAADVENVWNSHMEPDAVTNGVPADIVAFLRERMLKNSPTGLVAMAREVLSCPDRVDELAKLAREAGFPVLVLYGENDDAWEPSAQALMADRLGAAKVVIPGAAHSPAVEAPETTASALAGFWHKAEHPAR